MAKYVQKEPRSNNEFFNMPSIDCRSSRYHITKDNVKELDLCEVKAICDKYNIGMARIDDTFGDDGCEFVFYVRVEEFGDEDKKKCYNEYKNGNRLAFKPKWDLEEKYYPRMLELHKCINELDQNTNLFFDYGWPGNCGRFGSDDVTRQVYSEGKHICTWSDINDQWSDMIHNTSRVLSKKGGYILMFSHYFKIDPKDVFNEFTIESAYETIKEMFPKEDIKLTEGKRVVDGESPSYQAILFGEGVNQRGHMTFKKDINGIVHASVRVPLAGEYSVLITKDNMKNTLRDECKFILN